MQIESAVVAAVASFVGAWLAAQLAFARFAREKAWERKTAAYTAIFDALHLVGRWYEKHYEAAITARDLSEADKQQLQKEATQAEYDLERRLASETWLLPAQCRARLEKMTRDLKSSWSSHKDDWQGFLDEGNATVQNATEDMRLLVVADLNLERKWHQLFW